MLRLMGLGDLSQEKVTEEEIRHLVSESHGQGVIDADERLPITGVAPGTYDAKLKDVSGRTCIVRNIDVKAGQIFSIEENELTSCTR